MAERPYFRCSCDELEDIADANKDSLKIQEAILFELSFRKTNSAHLLLNVVTQRIHELKQQKIRPFDEYLQKENLYGLDVIKRRLGLSIGYKLRGKIIGVTGSFPYKENLIRSLVFWQGGINSNFGLWQNDQIVVLGQQDFNEEYLIQTIKYIIKYNLLIFFLSQEAFLDYFDSGIPTIYYPNDQRIENHDGLSYLASIGFEWPTTYVTPRENHDTGGYSSFDRSDHPLAVVFGYTVRKGTPITRRQKALKRAIRPWPMGLGLKEVVTHIAYLVKDRKKHQPERLRNAIRCWEYDLKWLYDDYYVDSIYEFVWPSY